MADNILGSANRHFEWTGWLSAKAGGKGVESSFGFLGLHWSESFVSVEQTGWRIWTGGAGQEFCEKQAVAGYWKPVFSGRSAMASLDSEVREECLREDLKFYFMSPCEKYRARRQIPWKLGLQILKIVMVTTQVTHTTTLSSAVSCTCLLVCKTHTTEVHETKIKLLPEGRAQVEVQFRWSGFDKQRLRLHKNQIREGSHRREFLNSPISNPCEVHRCQRCSQKSIRSYLKCF